MKILAKIRVYKKCALIMVWLLVFQIAFPSVSLALTSGPTQPEVQSFEPVGSTQMVDLFSGDFNYNIPLLEIPGANGGYPINLFYNSVTSADEEASMVGLGWNIGIGALTNQVRGLPDALNGEQVKRRTDMKNNWTLGLGASVGTPKDLEVFGADFDEIDMPFISGSFPNLTSGTQTQTYQSQDSWLQLSLGFKGLYNSYKGFGYSIDPGFALNMNNKMGAKPKVSSNFGFSLNSLEGASVNASVSLSNLYDNSKKIRNGNIGLGVNLNGRNGISFNGGVGYEKQKQKKGEEGGSKSVSRQGATTYTFPQTSYTPQVELPFGGMNVALTYKGGGEIFGVFLNGSLSGSFASQWLKNKNDWVSVPAFGYMHLQHADAKRKSLMDFNREKEGAVYKAQDYLSIPVLTADILSVSGHGVGGSYRAYRSDWGGTLYDPEVTSRSAGGSLGIEAGVGSGTHVGVDLALNYSQSSSNRRFFDTNNNRDLFFSDKELGSDFEPYYYKAMAEKTTEQNENLYSNINNDKPIHIERNGLNFGEKFVDDGSWASSDFNVLELKRPHQDRRARNSSIQPITNKELLSATNEVLLPEFDIQFYDETRTSPNQQPLDIRSANYSNSTPLVRGVSNDQIAGYTVVNEGGVKWNYGLPVINDKQYQATYSASNTTCSKTIDIDKNGDDIESKTNGINYDIEDTNEYLDIISTPSYAHAHLLTSVLGTDYIDVNNDGPGEGDLGYWMKVDYVKTSDEYQWKTPFNGANFIEGYRMKIDDDKASFSAGEREQYYPARIETNTHVAEFEYLRREDSRGASNLLQNSSDPLGDYSYKLDKIKLYSKIEFDNASGTPTPIKTIHFGYEQNIANQLCNGIPNAGSGGKLTLTEVWFTYENSTRGELSPYKFEYQGTNEDYEENAFDKWGSYKEPSASNSACVDKISDINDPYVKQGDQNLAKLKDDVTTWHLTDIFLPSGSHIEINIHRDHYAYVQNRVATRMFNIIGAGDSHSNDSFSSSSLGDQDDLNNGTLNDDGRRIYFNLETPTASQEELDKYFEDLYVTNEGFKQLFYKASVDLINDNLPLEKYEDVTGYVEIDSYDFDLNSLDNNNEYTRASILLRPFPLRHKKKYYNPIVMGNWQFLKVNLPDQMFGYDLGGDFPNSFEDIADRAGQFAGLLSEVISTFRKYYSVCKSRDYGTRFNPNRSFIRLNSPDKIQYGDGVRVEKVTMTDTYWGAIEETPTYGVVYDYSTDEEIFDETLNKFVKTGNKISSGVATNEPAIGKEECALRYAKTFVDDIKMRQDNQFIFEFPINESYYPGPSVGYSKVTVKSLASEYALKRTTGEPLPSELPPDLPDGFATSGVTVNEFYTSKDFPVITKSTTMSKDDNRVKWIPIPFIGDIRVNHFMGTQGYTIELNDMHGKPKKVINYAQDNVGNVIEEPVSSVEYKYQEAEAEMITIGNKQLLARKLDNNVRVLLSEELVGANTERDDIAELGVEREIFNDVRETRSISGNGGVNFNIEVVTVPIPIPVPGPWPSIGYADNLVRTSVTNKVIRRSGILKEVIASDGQSIVKTENLFYDKYTGAPILTSVNNSYKNAFGDPDKIYNYNIPGHFAYDGMGPAYENWGLEFEAEIGNEDNNTGLYAIDINTANTNNVLDADIVDQILFEGDEMIAKSPSYSSRVTFVQRNTETNGAADGTRYFHFDNQPTVGEVYKFKIVRSGKRNHLSASIGNIASLGTNPTENRSFDDCCIGGGGGGGGGGTSINNGGTGGLPNHAREDIDISECCFTEYQIINDVLNASATTFSDVWSNESGYECVSDVNNNDPFRNGERGIWRPYRTHAYVTDRSQSQNVDLSQDGTYTLKAFDWRRPVEEYCHDDWRVTETITKYGNNSAALESENILGLFNSALYGYNDHLPTAVTSNSRYYEIGFDGFEQYDMGGLATLDLSNYNSDVRESGHLQFLNPCTTSANYSHKVHNRIYGIFAANETELVLENIYQSNFGNPTRATFVVQSMDDGKTYTIERSGIALNTSTNRITFSDLSDILPNPNNDNCKRYTGRVILHFDTPINALDNSGKELYISGPGHTGKRSLFVPDPIEFNQNILKLIPNEKYVFSAWVKTSIPEPVPTYDDGYLKVEIKMGNATSTLVPSGSIIDGWQRIEGEFTYNGQPLSIKVYPNNNGNPASYDDFRIFPADGNIQTYVYDETNYRLTEMLDNNNYFIRYKYDSEGSLISVQKETVEGIKTLQESGKYTYSQD